MIKRVIDYMKEVGYSEGNKIYCYQSRGKLNRLFDDEGMVCFDTDEFERYKAKAKRGRPAKILNKITKNKRRKSV